MNRATVHQALQILKREGWIETNKGGGTRVVRRSSAAPVLGPAPAWDRIASSLLLRIVAEPPAAEPVSSPYDLSRLAPDERDFPAAAFAALLAEVARDGALLAYGSPFGYRPLRETLAERLSRRGIAADPDALLIVNGAQQGLDLITRALVDPGDAVAVESPSYSGALSLLRAHRARLLGVPLDAEGMEPAAFERALAERPKFVYAIPDFQNPTGLLASAPRRAEIAGRAAAAGVLLVEDAFDADLLVEGELPPPLAALAPEHVVHLGTISKALFPGVRVGWIAGPREFVHRLAALKRVGELTSPPRPAGRAEPLPDARRLRPPPRADARAAEEPPRPRPPDGPEPLPDRHGRRAPRRRVGPLGAPARGRVRPRARGGGARAGRPPLGRRRLLARPVRRVRHPRLRRARAPPPTSRRPSRSRAPAARELARQAARQKKGRAKAARDASDAKEAALIQI